MESIKNGHIWKQELIDALNRFSTQKMSIANSYEFRKFCDSLNKERGPIIDVLKVNWEKLQAKDPEVEKEINEFLSRDCPLSPLPHDILSKVDEISPLDLTMIEPLVAKPPSSPDLKLV